MMKQCLCILLLFTCLGLANGQGTARFSGQVLDSASRLPLELATASILNADSSLLGYQISDRNGRFVFEKLPLGKNMLLNISYVGYSVYSKTLLLAKNDSVTVLLTVNNDSSGVVVKSIIPIRMNGDTLEINPAAFKMKPNAVMEEMLNEVSGMTIWSDGTITVNGKRVQNFFVDGKPFLGSTDPRVATQNLPKTAIDKIQVYQEYDRSKIGEQDKPLDSLLTMNVKLKEGSKTGYFGKTGAGYGTTGRYEADLSFQMYNKRSSLGIGGGLNNINKNIQSLQEIFQNSTFRSFNPNLYNTGRFGASGINKNHSLGASLVHSFIESSNSRQNNRITFNYQVSGSNTFLTSESLQNRTTVANPQLVTSENRQENSNDKHAFSLNYSKSTSYSNTMNLSGNMDINNSRGVSQQLVEVRDGVGNLQSTNRTAGSQTGQSHNEYLNFNLAHSNEDNPVTGFNLQLSGRHYYNISERNTNVVFQSLINPASDTAYNRRYGNTSESFSISGSLNYSGFRRLLFGRFNLFGISVNFNQNFNYNRSSNDAKVSDFDSSAKQYVSNNRLSNYNRQQYFEYTPSLVLARSFSKFDGRGIRFIALNLGLYEDFKSDRNISSVANRNLQRSFRFFRYQGTVYLQMQRNNKYSLGSSFNYSNSFDYPGIDQLNPIVDDINAYEIRIGNPNLKNRESRRLNYNISFNTQNPKSLYSVNGSINMGVNRTLNPVVDSVINDPAGKRISYYTNAGHSQGNNAGFNFNISRKIRKNSLQLMYNMNYSSNEAPNYIDREYTLSKSNNLSNQFSLQFSLRTVMVINVGKGFQRYTTKQTAAGLTGFTNTSQTTRIGFTLNYPENFSFSTTLDEVSNSNLAKPTTLWNSFATYRFMKQQAELKLSAMDILKQYKNISNNANSYGTTTTVTNGLQQYFMLTFSYYPRRIGGQDIKMQATEIRF